MKFWISIIPMLLESMAHTTASNEGDWDYVYGPKKKLGNGFMQNYVIFDSDDIPVEIGVELEESLMDLSTLPQEYSDGKYDIIEATSREVGWFCCGHETELKSFDGSRFDNIPFTHFVSNWNPQGHAPMGQFDVPHFDFHFYLISKQQRLALKAPRTLQDFCPRLEDPFGIKIPLSCEDLDIATAPIPTDQIPPFHVCPFAGATVEPAMGNHL